ncbi:MAG: 3-isopropylmalate dehydratase [candidate division Zixibacteria bacterium]|nr:3-isopropylmalate dehydratase [Candidatus Tariuqbacter arcticus]
MTKQTKFSGRAWVVDVPDVDTDMIFHNRHLAITEKEKMAPHTFGNLPGWEDFPGKAQPGDILIVGHNFGCGSSRQQAVDCFSALGVTAIVGESFGAIYFRNAVNSGMPIIVTDNITKSGIANGDTIEVDLEKSIISCPEKNITIQANTFSKVQMDIYQAGDLFTYGKSLAN